MDRVNSFGESCNKFSFKKGLKRMSKINHIKKVASNRMLFAGGLIVFTISIVAIFAQFIAPYNPLEMNVQNRLQSPNSIHWFGTDEFGRDVFSRVIYGTQITMKVGLLVVLFTGIAGMVIGILAAYYKALDNLLMRITDALMAFPEILLAIAIVAALGAGLKNVVIALSIVYTPQIARVVRSAALIEREKGYIEAIRALGAKHWRIMLLHLLPNCLTPFIVQITFVFAYTVIVEASLSFLGAGTPPPEPSLGNIINEGTTILREAWWIMVFPGLFIMVIVLGLNLLGDGLRDQLDPSINHSKKQK